jgi:hypothetical protein
MVNLGTTVVMGLQYDGLVCDSDLRQWLWGCDMMDWGTVAMGL